MLYRFDWRIVLCSILFFSFSISLSLYLSSVAFLCVPVACVLFIIQTNNKVCFCFCSYFVRSRSRSRSFLMKSKCFNGIMSLQPIWLLNWTNEWMNWVYVYGRRPTNRDGTLNFQSTFKSICHFGVVKINLKSVIEFRRLCWCKIRQKESITTREKHAVDKVTHQLGNLDGRSYLLIG